MKYTYKYIRLAIVTIVAAISISSCSEPLNIDYIDRDPMVVVKAINEVDSTFALRLTYSRWFLDNHPFKEIDDADVTLFVNGNKAGNGILTTINTKKILCYKQLRSKGKRQSGTIDTSTRIRRGNSKM